VIVWLANLRLAVIEVYCDFKFLSKMQCFGGKITQNQKWANWRQDQFSKKTDDFICVNLRNLRDSSL
jgi:hypothetical protein